MWILKLNVLQRSSKSFITLDVSDVAEDDWMTFVAEEIHKASTFGPTSFCRNKNISHEQQVTLLNLYICHTLSQLCKMKAVQRNSKLPLTAFHVHNAFSSCDAHDHVSMCGLPDGLQTGTEWIKAMNVSMVVWPPVSFSCAWVTQVLREDSRGRVLPSILDAIYRELFRTDSHFSTRNLKEQKTTVAWLNPF